MNTPKVVITASGALCNLGNTAATVAQGLTDWPSATSVQNFEFHSFDAPVPCFKAQGYDPEVVLGKKGLRLKDWSTKMLLGVFETEFKALLEGFEPSARPGICVGTAFGSVQSIGDFLSDSIVNGVNNVNPQLFANTVINSPTGNANIRYDVKPLSATIATGFNAGIDAIIYAADQIRQGYYQAIIAGGLEEVSYYSLLGLERTGVLSQNGSMRPFAIDCDGFIVGEGCGLLLLESEEHARARGATILAEVAGVASTFDSDPSNGGFGAQAEGAQAAILSACDMAGIATSQIGFVAASANGTRAGDTMEALALSTLTPNVAVAAYKAKTGECYGASSALNVVCALNDAVSKKVSATGRGYQTVQGITLLNTPAAPATDSVLINAFSCDGNCSSIVLKVV